MRTVALVGDLMDRSRLAPIAGIHFVSSATELEAAVGTGDTVVIDLTRPGALEAVRALKGAGRGGGRIYGFAGHLERELMTEARRAGCDRVLARSALFKQARQLLS
ncbi:MAG: hypothetical protein ACYDH5_11145 [Acidimicrobiales bacterium]